MADFSDARLIDAMRQAMLTLDDSGICELGLHRPHRRPLAGGLPPKRFKYRSSIDSSASGDDDAGASSTNDDSDDGEEWSSRPHSPDVQLDDSRRPRTRTTAELDLMRQQRAKQHKVSTVVWRNPADAGYTQLQKTSLSEALVPAVIPELKKKKSIVSSMIAASPAMEGNPFKHYAKFEAQKDSPLAKQYKIFLPISASELLVGTKPMVVSVQNTARITDLVGLVCFKYTADDIKPPLTGDVSDYQIYMAEEDGEIEWDLPPLDQTQMVNRFGFQCLALIFSPKSPPVSADISIIVTKDDIQGGIAESSSVVAHFTNGMAFKLEYPNLNQVTVARMRSEALELYRPHANIPKGNDQLLLSRAEYLVENVNEPGVVISEDHTLAQTGLDQFLIIRKNSSRGDFGLSVKSHVDSIATIAPHSQSSEGSYNADDRQQTSSMARRLTSQSLDIDAIMSNTDVEQFSFVLFTNRFVSKPITLTLQSERIEMTNGKCINFVDVGGVEVVREKHGRKASIRLCYRGTKSNDWRSKHIEGDQAQIDRFTRKLNDLLDRLGSPARQDFFASYKPRKSSTIKWKIPSFGNEKGNIASGSPTSPQKTIASTSTMFSRSNTTPKW